MRRWPRSLEVTFLKPAVVIKSHPRSKISELYSPQALLPVVTCIRLGLDRPHPVNRYSPVAEEYIFYTMFSCQTVFAAQQLVLLHTKILMN